MDGEGGDNVSVRENRLHAEPESWARNHKADLGRGALGVGGGVSPVHWGKRKVTSEKSFRGGKLTRLRARNDKSGKSALVTRKKLKAVLTNPSEGPTLGAKIAKRCDRGYVKTKKNKDAPSGGRTKKKPAGVKNGVPPRETT